MAKRKSAKKSASRSAKSGAVRKRVSLTKSVNKFDQPNYIRRQTDRIVRNLIITAILFIVSCLIYSVTYFPFYKNLFFAISIILGFLVIAFIISFLVMIFLKVMGK